MRLSKTLAIAVSSIGLFWIWIWILSSGVVREPWDLISAVLLLYICPIAGLFAALSSVKGDLTRGVRQWQLALGVVLSLGFFAYFLYVMTRH